MTPEQQRLFQMLRELVGICEENGIVYYAAGGTALGAARHGGFIPWDDDVDVMMPRSSWERFLEIARADGLPEGRALCCLELDENYGHVFGRYVDLTSTSIHYNQFLGESPEGFVIDIFILDPIEDGGRAYARHREALSLYNDLANPLGYSYPMSSSKNALRSYQERIRAEGRTAVLAELANALCACSEGEGEYLVMRWAAAPRLFHKSIFAFPRWEEFEGLRLSVPGKLNDYLVQHYGDDWACLPEGERRAVHDAITFLDVDYATVRADYLPFIDVGRAKKAILRRRQYHIDHLDELHRAEDLRARICAEFARAVTLERARAAGMLDDAADAACDLPSEKLDWVFEEYYAWQSKPELEGREEYLHIRRYHDPVLVEITPKLAAVALLNLLDTNRVGLAHRFLVVWERARGGLPPDLELVRETVDAVRMPASLADLGLSDDAFAISELVAARRPRNFSNMLFRLQALQAQGNEQTFSGELEDALRAFPDSGEFLKLACDARLREDGENFTVEQAVQRYRDALGKTSNAFVMQDAQRMACEQGHSKSHGATVDADRACAELREAAANAVQAVPRARSFGDADAIGEKTLRLLDEVAALCREFGIAHFLGPESARLALAFGCNEPGMPKLDLLVDASRMEELAEGLMERAGRNRRVDCWLVNPRYLSFQVDYVDATTTYLDLDEGDNCSCHGAKVSIVPLRSAAAIPVGSAPDALEEGWELNGYQLTKGITAKRTAEAAAARAAMAGGRKRLARKLFRDLQRGFEVGRGSAYFRLPYRGRFEFAGEAFANAENVQFGGSSFPLACGMRDVLEAVYGKRWPEGARLLKAPYGKALVSATLPYENLLESLNAAGCAPGELFKLMKKVRIGMLPLANDLRVRNRAMAVAGRTRDRKRWCDYLDARASEIAGLLDAGDYAALGEVYAGYESDARAYLRKGLGLCPSKLHLDVLCLLLRERGEGQVASRLESLAPKEHYAPLSQSDVGADASDDPAMRQGMRENPPCATLRYVKTLAGMALAIGVDVDAEGVRAARFELRNPEASLGASLFVPATVRDAKQGSKVRCLFRLAELEFAGTFWDVFLQLDMADGRQLEAPVATTRAYRLVSQVLNDHCVLADGSIVFPRTGPGKQLSLTHRPVSQTDTLGHRAKELAALAIYAAGLPYWKRKRIWLVYEKFCSLAQDNGYYFFEYCMNEQPAARDFVYYVIDRDAPDYERVARHGRNVVDFLSLRHMVYAMAANIYVASDSRSHLYQWRPKPNVVRGRIAKNRILFLQHGVTAMKRVDPIYGAHGSSPVTYFLTTSEREQHIVEQNFGYPSDRTPILGFARWDVLQDRSDAVAPRVLVMPTWRPWLDEQPDDVFESSEYFAAYSALLRDERLHALLEERNAALTFFIHPKLAGYLEGFAGSGGRVRIAKPGDGPLNELLMTCSLLVTDYSSTSWDVLLMGKPVVYYQFDSDRYLREVGSYIDFEGELPGPVCHTLAECLQAVEVRLGDGCKLNAQERERAAAFLPHADGNNRERIWRFLIEEGF